MSSPSSSRGRVRKDLDSLVTSSCLLGGILVRICMYECMYVCTVVRKGRKDGRKEISRGVDGFCYDGACGETTRDSTHNEG